MTTDTQLKQLRAERKARQVKKHSEQVDRLFKKRRQFPSWRIKAAIAQLRFFRDF